MKKLCVLTVSLWLLFIPIHAQDSGSEQAQDNTAAEHKINRDYLHNAGEDFLGIISSPKEWGNEDILVFTAFMGSGILLYTVDEPVCDWLQESKSSSRDNAANIFSSFGDGTLLGGSMLALYLIGEAGNSDSLRKTALLGLESWIITGVVNGAFKVIIGRARPNTGEGHSSFRPFSFESGRLSLPSGHAASAFAVAAVIADRSRSIFIDVGVYGLASCVAISRMYKNKHWVSDVFLGSALGYFIGKQVCALNRLKRNNKVNISISPDPFAQGITFTLSF